MRRSLLFIPANNPAMMQNASLFFADGIIFDLEDAVAINEKDSARVLLYNYLRNQEFDFELIIRINDLDTKYAEDDLNLLVSDSIDTIMLPKALPGTLKKLDSILTSIEKIKKLKKKIKVIPIIEEAMSFLRIEEIATAARVNGLLLGAEDFTRDLEIERTKEANEIMFIRSQCAIVAKAYRLDAIDTPFTDVNDEEGLIKDSMLAKSLAMNAKSCIHPNQITVVNEIFSPSKDQIAWAKRVVAASKLNQQGVFSLDGKMIDKPIIQRSENILAKARRFNLL